MVSGCQTAWLRNIILNTTPQLVWRSTGGWEKLWHHADIITEHQKLWHHADIITEHPKEQAKMANNVNARSAITYREDMRACSEVYIHQTPLGRHSMRNATRCPVLKTKELSVVTRTGCVSGVSLWQSQTVWEGKGFTDVLNVPNLISHCPVSAGLRLRDIYIPGSGARVVFSKSALKTHVFKT